MLERHATLIFFFFSISMSMNIVKIQDKPQRGHRYLCPHTSEGDEMYIDIYPHSKYFILNSV